jgi:hypothetical protein
VWGSFEKFEKKLEVGDEDEASQVTIFKQN